MNKVPGLLFLLLMFFVFMAQAAEWPADALDENDPNVIAYYKATCEQWAGEENLSGANRDEFIKGCVADAPQIWPVGIDEKD